MRQLHIESAVENRQRLRRRLKKDEIVVVFGRGEVVRNNDVHYIFRQNSDFLHLTGFNEPDARLVLTSREEIFFIPKVSQTHLVWLGEAETVESAKKKYHMKKVCYNDDFEEIMRRLVQGRRRCLLHGDTHSSLTDLLPKRLTLDRDGFKTVMTDLRAVKNEYEKEMMRYICRKTSEAHIEVMMRTRAGLFEDQMENVFGSFLKDRRIREYSYPAIVATGKNSAVLHYHHNRDRLKSGQLLLIDAGGEENGYAADITRTYPVNGKFSKRQREIYEVVLEAQMACIKMIKPGIWLSDIQEQAVKSIVQGLVRLGLLKGEVEDLIHQKAHSLFFMHGVSHMLGLDVHDSTPKPPADAKPKGNMRSQAKLVPGNIITVEPGIYFIPALLNDPEKRKQFAGQVNWKKAEKLLDFGGIRIEDDVLVTAKGHEVLTSVPKKVADIEKVMRAGRSAG